MKDLTTSINALSSSNANPQTSDQVATLVTQRSNDETQLSQLQAQIQQQQLNLTSVTTGSHILDPAAVSAKSAKKIMVTDGISGLIAGLGLGLALVLVPFVMSDKLRRREEIASALGTPVELTVKRYRPTRLLRRSRLQKRMASLDPELQKVEARLRAHLELAPGSALATVAIESEPAALVVGALALSLVAEGKRVAVVDMTEDSALSSLLGTRANDQLILIEAPPDPLLMDTTLRPADIDALLVLATPTPALGADPIAEWATQAVALVNAGRANAARLTATAQLLRMAGVVLKAAILIGGDPDDDTLGQIAAPAPVSSNGKPASAAPLRVSEQ
jgi:hypothetical protein